MNSKVIKTAQKNKGYDMSMIALVLGKSPSLISKVINGKATSLPVAKAVSKVLGKKVSEVFPHQYVPRAASDYRQSKAYREKQEELRKLLSDS